MRPKTLVISFYFPPFNGPATQHALWFFDFMPDSGVETVALTTSLYYPRDKNTEEAGPAGNIIRVPVTPSLSFWRQLYKAELFLQLRGDVWEPGFVWAEFAVRAARRRLRRESFTSIVSVSPSVASHLVALRLKKRLPHLKWIADFTDPFLGNPFRCSKDFIRPLERRLERAIFTAADYVSANTDTVQAMWQERYPEFRDKFVVTWGGYDPREEVSPRPLPLRPAPLLSHTGAVYQLRVPNALFDSLHRLLQQGRLQPSRLLVEFIGEHQFQFFQSPEKVERLQAEGILRFRNGYIPRAEALQAAEESNYLLLLDITGHHNTKFQVPSKLFDYVRIGRPILAFTPGGSPSEYILSRSGVPHTVIHTEASPQEVDEGILQFLALPSAPQPSSAWFLETFDARRLAKSVVSLMRNHPADQTRPAPPVSF
jgi:hypothetical protein